jgi:ADP-heptose:LPS heptosyltransferase
MVSNPLYVHGVKKIAVIRANALGDFIVTLPALQAIRDVYPQAEIVLLGKPWHRQYLAGGRTPVDRVVEVPVKKGIREETGLTEDAEALAFFFAQMEKEQFDIAVSFQGNGISATPFLKKLGARLTVGFTCAEASMQPDRYLQYYYYQSEVIRFLELSRLIGATVTQLEPDIKVLQEDKAEIAPLMAQLQGKPYIVMHPVAMDIRRAWPYERYAALADYFSEKGFAVVFTGAAADKPVIENIVANVQLPAINTAGMYSLGGLTALLASAALVIGADTGPMHLARAVQARSIGFYWAPNLVNWGPLSRGKHRPLISWSMACPLCGVVPNQPYPYLPQNGCEHQVSFVRDIAVEEVIQAAEGLLPVFSSMPGNETAVLYE